MIETIGMFASILGILAFFAVSPKDLFKNFKEWFITPINSIKKNKNAIDLQTLFTKLNVDDIRIENIFLEEQITYKRFQSIIIKYKGKLPEKINVIKSNELKKRKNNAEEKGITLDNNASFALRRIDVSHPEGISGKRENIYKLILEETDYFSFIFPNTCLDKEYYNEETQEQHKLRELLGLEKERLRISDLEDFPNIQFKMGTGTLVITNDNYLICSVRSKKQAIAGKQKTEELAIHLSAAEGMYRSRTNPKSSDSFEDDIITPFATSIRSLEDELNLGNMKYKKEDISCLGYFFDTKRAQPFFLFYLKIDMSCEDFFQNYSNTTIDIHENDAIFALDIQFDNINKLFNGVKFNELNTNYPKLYEDFFSLNSSSITRIASNHAKAGFATLAIKDTSPITSDML